MNKPPFDPSQPFQEAKPAFDPSQPFQEVGPEQPEAQPMTIRGFGENAISDVKDIASSIPGAAWQMTVLPKKFLVDMPKGIYETGKQMYQGKPFLQTPAGQQVGQLGSMVKSLPENILHPYDHPVKAALDAATAVGLATDVAKPFIPSIGKTVGNGLEQFSGLEHRTPGVLGQAYNDSSLIFGPNTDKAREIYRSTQNEDLIRPELANAEAKTDLVSQAKKILSEGGTLTADEALEARKALDKTKKHWSDVFFRQTRTQLDKIAKESFETADKSYSRAVKSEALRSVFPLNKTGGSSSFKTSLLAPMLPIMSPASQGLMATGAGVAARRIFSPLSRVAPVLGSYRMGMQNPVKESTDLNQNLNSYDKRNSQDGKPQPSNAQAESKLNHNSPKVITEKKAREYLKKASLQTEDRQKQKQIARAMAVNDGWALA